MNDINKALETKDPIEKATDLLHKMASAESMIKKYTDTANVKIEAIKNELEAESKIYVDMLEVLKADLQNLANEHKDQLCPVLYDKKGNEKKKRSLILKFGEFGFRKTASITILFEEKTAKLIEEDEKELAESTGINLTLSRPPKFDLRKLHGFEDDVLEKFGIKRDTEEKFFCESNPESVLAELEEVKNVS
ncbi:MAG: host-nuclease inhibitor Gam family protein [Leptospirales bacterium]|nr:host-nuclease inhibitor Gam family protein [Leptospirales bacterium]